MVEQKLSDKKFWDEYWNNEKRVVTDFGFSKVMESFIDFKKVKSYMEIGGAPGVIMTYIHNKYNVEVSAIDFVNKSYIENVMKENNITNYHVYEADFTEFDTESHTKKYDLVASWGFVEHFEINTCKNIIEKQKNLVEKNGYLIIELPNIRKFNWLLYRIFNKKLLDIHNMETMSIPFLREQILKNDDYKLLYGNYYLTCFLGYNSSSDYLKKHMILKNLFVTMQNLMKKLKIDNIQNQTFSPYILMIAKRIR